MLVQARGCLLLSFAIVAGTFRANADQGAAKLLDQTIHDPGNWSQMCAIPPPLPFNVPFPLYSLAVPRFSTLAPENVSRLKAQRADVVHEITTRLHELDLSKHTWQRSGLSMLQNSGQDPHGLSGLLLQIIMDLNAVETLPELLRLESDLNQRIETANYNTNAPLPDLDLDSPVAWQEMDIVHPSPTQQDRRLFAARVYQRELLSVIATLLRHEKFEPLLKSDIEARYIELLRHEKDPEASPTWDYDRERYMPYTPELRHEIREFAQEFLKQPAEKTGQALSANGK
jgi:hypothetical protein